MRTPHRRRIIDAVRTLASGEALFSPEVTSRVIRRFQPQAASPAVPVAGSWGLSNRERAVVVLIADGLSNGEIAGALRVAVTTVKTHMSHTPTKLQLRDRVQLVAFAYRNNLTGPGEESSLRGLDIGGEDVVDA